jgi:hypothetical protein
MCQILDGLPSTIVVTKNRKDIMRIIEEFVVGPPDEEDGGAEQQGSSSEEESDEEDEPYYNAAASKNVKLRQLFEKRKAAKEKMQNVRNPVSELPLHEAIEKQDDLKKRTLAAKNAEERARYEKEKEDNRFVKKETGGGERKMRKTFVSFEPWACSLCGKKNEARETKCATCGRAKTHGLEKERAKAAEKAKTESADTEEAKKKAAEAKKINDEYVRASEPKNMARRSILVKQGAAPRRRRRRRFGPQSSPSPPHPSLALAQVHALPGHEDEDRHGGR